MTTYQGKYLKYRRFSSYALVFTLMQMLSHATSYGYLFVFHFASGYFVVSRVWSMDTHRLRGILLRLQDRLSDEDRRRLHFFLGDDIPRRVRDDPTLSGTLSLMESLFDHDQISGADFTLLIDAFDEIQCHDAARILRGSH